jgi:hypothetical protein
LTAGFSDSCGQVPAAGFAGVAAVAAFADWAGFTGVAGAAASTGFAGSAGVAGFAGITHPAGFGFFGDKNGAEDFTDSFFLAGIFSTVFASSA